MFFHQQPGAAFARYDGALYRVFFDFPFTFTKDLQSGGINHQMCNLTPGGCFETNINRPDPITDAGVIRASQRNAHQGKDGINKTLRSPQCQLEYAFNHQHGGDGKVRIALRPPREESVADSYQA